jgi:hypothetical protein
VSGHSLSTSAQGSPHLVGRTRPSSATAADATFSTISNGEAAAAQDL